ncbi:MAG: hypothetical protein JXR49_18460 [Acidobacteria bacterium]|nr:hypothetical protein [Acidobacteriota bacterium]
MMGCKVTMKNGRTEIRLDERGNIVAVTDVKTGHRYFEAPPSAARLFHLMIQVPGWCRPIASHEAPPPSLKDTPDGKVLVYKNLLVDDGQVYDIDVEVHFTMPADTDEILMSMRLQNNSNNTVIGATFPWVNGWQSPADPAEDRVQLGAGVSPIKPAALLEWRIPAWGNGIGEEYSQDHPVFTIVPWIDFSSLKGGVSCINYQKTSRLCYAGLKNMAEFHPTDCIPGMFWGFYPYVTPGKSWQSPEVGLAVHDGDWHETADRYRAWADTWLKSAQSDPDIKESIGSLHVYLTDFTGIEHNSYDSIPEIAAEARKYGVKELCIWDYLTLGLYCPFPGRGGDIDLLKYPPQDKRRIKDGIRKAVEEGSDVSALINFRLINSMLDVFKENDYQNDTVKTLYGDDRREAYILTPVPGKFLLNSGNNYLDCSCNVFTPFSDKVHRRVLRFLEEYLDFGYTSLFYDQPFELYPDYSRTDSGGIPENTHAAVLDLIAKVRKELRRKNPSAAIMGEYCDIFAINVIDQWMCWTWSECPGGIETLAKLRYSIPQTILNYVLSVDSGLPEACLGQASHAFAIGLHLFLVVDALQKTLSAVPQVGEYVRKLAALRKHCAQRIVHARFCDSRGVTVATDDGLVAYSYDSPSGPAVVIAAPEKSGSAEIQLQREYFSHQGSTGGTVCSLDLDVREISGDVQTFQLEKHDVVVWMA